MDCDLLFGKSQSGSGLAVKKTQPKKPHGKNKIVCQKCGQHGHVKLYCMFGFENMPLPNEVLFKILDFLCLYSKNNSNFLKVNQLTKIMFAWMLMNVRISMMVKKYAQMVGASTGILDIFAFAIRDSYHHKTRKHASMPGRVRLRMDAQVTG